MCTVRYVLISGKYIYEVTYNNKVGYLLLHYFLTSLTGFI